MGRWKDYAGGRGTLRSVGRFGVARGVVVGLGLWLLGCGRVKSGDTPLEQGGGGEPNGAGGTGSGAGGTASGAGGTASGAGGTGSDSPAELVIPFEPRTEASIPLGLQFEAGAQVGFADHTVTFAIGEGYPETVLFDFDGSYLVDGMTANSTFWSVNVAVSSVSAEGDGIEVRAVGSDQIELSVREPGDYALTLEGEVSSAEPGEYPPTAFRVPLTVSGRRIAGVSWHSCDAPAYVLPGASLPPRVYFRPFDEAGNTLYPVNVTTERSVTVSVHGAPGTSLSLAAEEEGIRSLRVSGSPQTIEVRSAFGPVGSFELIDPARVDGLGALFQLHGVGRSALTLESGESYSFGVGSSWIGVVPALSVGGWPVCSVPGDDLFTFESLTPEACAITPRESCTASCDLGLLETGASVLANGACELVLEAPEFAGGTGQSVSLAVDFPE
jgi:hypothetical protein